MQIVSLENRTVTQVVFDTVCTFQLSHPQDELVEVRVEGAFSILTERARHEISPANRQSHGIPLDLLQEKTTHAIIQEAGALMIYFVNYYEIIVQPGTSWRLSGPQGWFASVSGYGVAAYGVPPA